MTTLRTCLCCAALLALLCLATAAGCDVGRSTELAAKVEQLSAENDRLAAENARLSIENDRLQNDLESANEKLDEFVRQREQLKAAGIEQIQQLMKQWGAGMNTAKELGLPELKDFNLEDLLNPPASPEEQSSTDDPEP